MNKTASNISSSHILQSFRPKNSGSLFYGVTKLGSLEALIQRYAFGDVLRRLIILTISRIAFKENEGRYSGVVSRVKRRAHTCSGKRIGAQLTQSLIPRELCRLSTVGFVQKPQRRSPLCRTTLPPILRLLLAPSFQSAVYK